MPAKKQPPMLAAPPKVEPTIPLHCLLCPKRPSFSDVSHLLTHISSKSHLSNRFKAEIRSASERDARETLRQFDVWYDRYGIQDLLADRMSAKDKKNGRKGGRAQSPDRKPRSYNKRDALIKPDPDEDEPVSRRYNNASLHAHSSRQEHSFDDSPTQTPATRRSQRLISTNRASKRKLPSLDSIEDDEPAEDNGFQVEDSVEVAVVEETSDKSKLKGVLWPGMSLFDSATEDQKRKRNQRKDVGVLRRMERVAAGVEPTEGIYSEDFDLQRTRDIYATPSVFGSPEPEVEQPKKKRARRATTAVKTGAGRQKRAPAKAVRSKKEIKQEQVDDDDSIVLSHEDSDGTPETTPPVDDLSSEGKPTSSSVMDSPDHVHDVFRDPPPAGSGQFDASLQPYLYDHQLFEPQCYDPQLLSSPALTWDSSGLVDASLYGLNFDPHRPALQPLSSNIAMNSPSANSFKHLPHLRRGRSEMSVLAHSPSPTPFYSQPPNGSFNDALSFAHNRPQLSYTNPFTGNGAFGEDPKPLISGFQPINLTHGLPSYHSYPVPNGGNSYYTAAAPDENSQEFEI